MWTKQTEILNFSKDFLDGVCVEEVLMVLKSLKISISTEEIQKRIESKTGQTQNSAITYIVNEEALMFNKKALSIHVNKGVVMCNILLAMSQDFSMVSNAILRLDLHVENDCVETKDLVRILKPLKANFMLAKEICEVGNSAELYVATKEFSNVKKKKKHLPKTSIFSFNVSKCEPDSIEMTENQKRQRIEMKKELSKKIYAENVGGIEKDC